METIVVLPGVGGATPDARAIRVSPSETTGGWRAVASGVDRRRRTVSPRLQALREGAAERVRVMPFGEDTAEEIADRADEADGWMLLQLSSDTFRDA